MHQELTRAGANEPLQSSDRRRPGRVGYQSPNLIELLRGDLSAATELEKPPIRIRDDLEPMKGIIASAIISVGFWALCGGLIWLVAYR
jgi:hypothetical protein